LLLAAVAGASLGLAVLAPAWASAPSIAENSAGANIVARGPNGSLKFYWAFNGSSHWHAETVAPAGSITSAPSIAENSAGANIVARGPNGSLKFYWAFNGSSHWHAETVAPAGSIT
jgi:hypothetical protein